MIKYGFQLLRPQIKKRPFDAIFFGGSRTIEIAVERAEMGKEEVNTAFSGVGVPTQEHARSSRGGVRVGETHFFGNGDRRTVSAPATPPLFQGTSRVRYIPKGSSNPRGFQGENFTTPGFGEGITESVTIRPEPSPRWVIKTRYITPAKDRTRYLPEGDQLNYRLDK
ncbi:hypothetical protein LXL04_000963 [Taraxacum kok-saghyz]